MVLVGDVEGKTAILVDDMADTCGTLVKAADVLIAEGAKDVLAIVTHGILSGNAIEALNGSKLKKIVVTNTVPHEDKKELCDRIETIDISPTVSRLLTETVPTLTINSLPKLAGGRTMARACHSSSSTHRSIRPCLHLLSCTRQNFCRCSTGVLGLRSKTSICHIFIHLISSLRGS
jgi:hypothetical protein